MANYLFLWSNSQRNFIIFKGGFNHLQALADEQVYAGQYHTIWKEQIRYQNVILLIDGFHQVRGRQKIICKQHNIISSCKWLTDAVVGGRHYYKSMRISKELFCVLVQHKGESINKKYQ